MCGITGFIQSVNDPQAIITAMADTLGHRGPDAGGIWFEQSEGIALGHRRLSILDLTDAGSQPMLSASGRYVLSYNGEIYNFKGLHEELMALGYPFRGHSDTEILLAAIDTWGVDQALLRISGMFAFAIWDKSNKTLILARDRVGKKPLYYGWCGKAFLFGSELKALLVHPEFDQTINRDALGQYIRYGWVPEPWSIYQSVRKLSPGCLIRLRPGAAPWSCKSEAYWRAKDVCAQAQSGRFSESYEAAVSHLDRLLGEAVKDRMIADVNLGALLSGGIDSTTVVALMQRNSTRPVKTFSIGFSEPKFNEAGFAASIADYLGTDHHELYVTPGQCLDVVSELPAVYDEPFADISQVPTLLVSRMARNDVTVVLSGDGGDELFGGYTHYFETLKQWQRIQNIPLWLRTPLVKGIKRVADYSWAVLQNSAGEGAKIAAWKRFGAKLEKRSRGWCSGAVQQLMLERFSRFSEPAELVIGCQGVRTDMNDPDNWLDTGDPLLKMRHLDFIGYLPGDILVKVDRASMSVGLEARCPILDTRVVEFAWSLPTSFLVDSSGGKRILRDLMARYVPTHLTDRPKRGFGAPVEDWLRGPLRDWAESYIQPSSLHEQGLFDSKTVQGIWKQHLAGWRNHANLLWAILMFQAWSDSRAP